MRINAEIDKFVNNLQNETDEMRDIQLKALNKHLQKVKELRTEIQDTIKANKDLLNSTNITKTLSYKSRNSVLKFYPEELKVSIRFISQPINGEVIAEIFGVGFSIMERRELLDLLAWILVKELFDQPKIQSVFETKIECPSNMAWHSKGKLWVAGNAGLLKLFNLNKQFDASQTKFWSNRRIFNIEKC